jgi:hypothetical protein
MAAVMDEDKMAGRQRGQREDECNNQIVVDCVRGERALNNTMHGGDERPKVSGRRTTPQEGAVNDARQAGGGQRAAIRWQAKQGNMAVDNKTRGGGMEDMMQGYQAVDDMVRHKEREDGNVLASVAMCTRNRRQ